MPPAYTYVPPTYSYSYSSSKPLVNPWTEKDSKPLANPWVDDEQAQLHERWASPGGPSLGTSEERKAINIINKVATFELHPTVQGHMRSEEGTFKRAEELLGWLFEEELQLLGITRAQLLESLDLIVNAERYQEFMADRSWEICYRDREPSLIVQHLEAVADLLCG